VIYDESPYLNYSSNLLKFLAYHAGRGRKEAWGTAGPYPSGRGAAEARRIMDASADLIMGSKFDIN